MGKYFIAFVKGTYTDKNGYSYNYLKEKLEFIMDNKNKIIYSKLSWNN